LKDSPAPISGPGAEAPKKRRKGSKKVVPEPTPTEDESEDYVGPSESTSDISATNTETLADLDAPSDPTQQEDQPPRESKRAKKARRKPEKALAAQAASDVKNQEGSSRTVTAITPLPPIETPTSDELLAISDKAWPALVAKTLHQLISPNRVELSGTDTRNAQAVLEALQATSKPITVITKKQLSLALEKAKETPEVSPKKTGRSALPAPEVFEAEVAPGVSNDTYEFLHRHGVST